MRPLRRRPKLAWLALLALAMQFALSFGHVHADEDEHDADHVVSQSCTPDVQRPCSPSHAPHS